MEGREKNEKSGTTNRPNFQTIGKQIPRHVEETSTMRGKVTYARLRQINFLETSMPSFLTFIISRRRNHMGDTHSSTTLDTILYNHSTSYLHKCK